MELKQLKYFIAVADAKNFSKAAQNLYVTQPALSQQITKLEYELGVTLIERTTRAVRLTKAGELLYQRSIPFLLDMENIVQDVKLVNDTGFHHETVRIGLIDSSFPLEHTALFEYFDCIRTQFSDVQFEFLPFRMETVAQSLSNNEFLIAFSITSNQILMTANIVERVLRRGRSALIVPKDWKVDWGTPEFYRLVNRSKIFFPETRCHWHGIMAAILIQNNCHLTYAATSCMTSALNLVAAGGGICFAPYDFIPLHDHPNFNCIRIPLDAADYRVSALWQKDNNNPLLRRLIHALPDYIDLR